MSNDLLVIIIQVSDMLREIYGLTLEESVKCISCYGDLSHLVKTKEDAEALTVGGIHELAKKMYETYEAEKQKSNSFISRLIERADQIKKIISNPEYVRWLDYFTENVTKFYVDDEWCYATDTDYSEGDLTNVSRLPLLFDGIMDYADKNGVAEVSIDSGLYYNVRYNDFMFQIGGLFGQGSSIFCERINNGEGIEFINFQDVMDSVKDKPAMKELTPPKDNK